MARYLIEVVQMDPQDRDEVCGVSGDCAGFKVQGLRVCMFSLCSEACCDKVGGQVYVQSYMCYSFRVLSQSLLTGSCLVMDHQCIVFASFSR